MSLEEFVKRMLLVPFVERGRDFDGVDCWGVVYLAYCHILGIELPSYIDDYDKKDVRGSSRELGQLVASHLPEWKQVSHPRVMDVAIFLIAGRPVHIGLLVDEQRVLHAEKGAGIFVERLYSPLWARRLEGIYRYE